MRIAFGQTSATPVFDALRTATAGMTAAATDAATAAKAIASPNEATASNPSPEIAGAQPRIGYLPVAGDPVSAFTMLFAAEFAFKANAAVLRTAHRMVEAVYKATD
jgi:hypothetical protein